MEENTPVVAAPKKPPLSIILVIIVSSLLFGLGGYFLGTYQERSKITQNSEYTNTQVAQVAPSISVSPTGTKTSGQPMFRAYPFSLTKEDIASNQLAQFTDDTLGVSFSYPKTYLLSSLKADKDNLNAQVYFLKYPDVNRQEDIKQNITCEETNRKEPMGVCSESTISDLDITISKVATSLQNTEYLTKNPYCVMSNELSNKTVYSCLQQNVAGVPDNEYTIIIKKDGYDYILTLNTHNVYSISEAIWTIGNTFTLNSL